MNIIVAVDLSKDAEILIKKGQKFAEKLGATLHVLNVNVDVIDYVPILEEPRTDAEEFLKPFTKGENIIIESGNFVSVVRDQIEKLNAKLLIMGHHQDFISNWFSASKQLVNNIDCDMLVVPLK